MDDKTRNAIALGAAGAVVGAQFMIALKDPGSPKGLDVPMASITVVTSVSTYWGPIYNTVTDEQYPPPVPPKPVTAKSA